MCGIHFILDKQSRLDFQPIEAMVAATPYRGPDKSEIKKFNIGKSQYFLGANKLSITDTSAFSNQPFFKNEYDSVLIFNGEIYNYHDLKNKQLEKGISFQSASDTEILYNHLESHREQGLKEINGMFSIVFLDISNGHFFIARDRWGMKPLFIFENDNYLICSSETKGILASGLVLKEINEIAVRQYLKYRYARRPNTFFKGISEFEPNTCRCYSDEGMVKEELIFSKVNSDTDKDFNPDGVGETVNLLLNEAILNHLASIGSTGLFLSGGVDSTLLLAKMDELGIRQVPAFSFVSSDEDRRYGTSDYTFARKAARQFQASHFEVTANKGILKNLDEYIARMDQPVGDSGALITYLLAREASNNLRVVLSGAGADELFAGYNRHRAFYYFLKHYQWIRYIKSAGKVSGNVLQFLGKPQGARLQKFFTSIDKDPATTWDNMTSFSEFCNLESKLLWQASGEAMMQALTDDQNNYLVNDVLAITDRMSMQASVEVRLPYLDLHLSEYIQTIPSEFLIRNGQKHILKNLLSSKGGKIYTQRPKEGLGLPFGAWINKENEGLWEFINVKDHLVSKFVDPQRILKMIREHQERKADHTLALWSVLVLARWLEFNFGK